MTKAKSKTKKIILLVIAALAAVVLAGCSASEEPAQTSSSPEASPSSQISSSSQTSASSQTSSTTSQLEPLSQEWKSINEVGEYQGMLDSPITEITLYGQAGNPYAQVTFSDTDLLQIWNHYLTGLQLQEYYRYSQEDQNQLVGSPPPTVTVTTETGEYTLYFTLGVTEIIHTEVSGEETLESRQWEDGNYRLQSGGLIYTLSDPEGFPFEQTYEAAAQRHGTTGP